MQKVSFLNYIDESLNRNKGFLVVKIQTEGHPAPEIIINPAENLDRKVNYYDKAYDDNMMLIKAKESGKSVRITDVLMTNNLNDLSWFAY